MAERAKPRVVILGGGFGGLYAARALRRAPAEVTILDRHNYTLFQPLLYQVATATLNASDIATPIRAILRRQSNTTVMLAEATRVDVGAKKVVLADGEITYDYLVVATGAAHSYFGRDEWAADAPGLKTVEDALEIRNRFLYAFEAAERETDPRRQQRWMTFVVIGGGPTGVEIAGALAEVAHHTLARDFRRVSPRQARFVLVEGLPSILSTFPVKLQQKAVSQLMRLGVEVRVGTRVTAIDSNGVVFGDERVEAGTVIWAAGVSASPIGQSLGAPLDRAGRVRVTQHLTLPGHDEVFVVGDLAAIEQDGRPVPGVAPAAIQMGAHTAGNILRTLAGQQLKPFRYLDKGSLATIGRSAAIAEFGKVRLWGWIAWVAWLTLHIFYLIGFRNRTVVFIDWAWSYLTFQRGGRLITGNPGRHEARAVPAAQGGKDAPV